MNEHKPFCDQINGWDSVINVRCILPRTLCNINRLAQANVKYIILFKAV